MSEKGARTHPCPLTACLFFWHPQSVEDDFVDMRKDDPQSVSAEDLHRMLVVARWAVIQFI